jgi:tetratricopeptide (TPR) repeat protein
MGSEYSVQQVRQLLGISPSTIRQLIAGGFVSPARGKRREYRFGFRDLVVLRMAKALTDAKLPPRRISRSLKRLREKLPDSPPLTGLRIAAIGNDVVVSDSGAYWRADDGQYVLSFEVSQRGGAVSFAPRSAPPVSDHDWFKLALSLEEDDAVQSMAAYEKAISVDARNSDAYANWGRLLHEAGRFEEAEGVYRRGAAACPENALLLFNFAVLCEDRSRWEEAIDLYQRALAHDPALSDAHYNLGRLYEARRRPRDAVRHFSAYRKLTTEPDSNN